MNSICYLLDHVGVIQKGSGVRQAFMAGRTDSRTPGRPENIMPSLASRQRHKNKCLFYNLLKLQHDIYTIFIKDYYRVHDKWMIKNQCQT